MHYNLRELHSLIIETCPEMSFDLRSELPIDSPTPSYNFRLCVPDEPPRLVKVSVSDSWSYAPSRLKKLRDTESKL